MFNTRILPLRELRKKNSLVILGKLVRSYFLIAAARAKNQLIAWPALERRGLQAFSWGNG
jgi:hypothetical protein